MTIVTVQFDNSKYKPYDTLLRVFRQSVRDHMPHATWKEFRIQAPVRDMSRAKNLTYNTRKLEVWAEYMETATENTIFCDCDLLALQPAYHAFDQPFDIGVTMRPPGSKPPMNGGVVFARPTEGARNFLRRWLDINHRMYVNMQFRQDWVRYLGMNQCAFGYLYETGAHDADLAEFPTRVWNAVDQDWKSIGDDTVFVHFKSELRRAVLHNIEGYGEYRRPLDAWFSVMDRLPNPPPMPPQESKVLKYRKMKRRGRVNR